MFSINTNVSAMVALANLNSTNSDLSKVQNRVSTGLKVSSAKEDASVFAVAQGLRANISSYDAVANGLASAKGLVGVALASATQISNLMSDMKTKLTQLSDGSLTSDQKTIYFNDLKQQIDQVKTFIDRANYNSVNLIAANAGTSGQNYSSWTAPQSQTYLQGVDASSFTLSSYNLSGNTAGTTGWLALARLVYDVGGAAADTAATNAIAATGYQVRTDFSNIANIARAALADISNATSAYYTSSTATTATTSVFGAAWATFNQQVNLALGQLGAQNRYINFQVDFNSSLKDSTKEGLGALVDADLSQESAMLTALQTKQQLGVQTLSIANQAPNSILSLFRQ
ncbi:MAG: flagellin [Alphaproteobacteria bacterium]